MVLQTRKKEMPMSKFHKGRKILNFIKDSRGARYGEIQRFICEMNGLDYDEREQFYPIQRPDAQRHIWDPKTMKSTKGAWYTPEPYDQRVYKFCTALPAPISSGQELTEKECNLFACYWIYTIEDGNLIRYSRKGSQFEVRKNYNRYSKQYSSCSYPTHYIYERNVEGKILGPMKPGRRKYRGYYSTTLSLLLNAWCHKDVDGKWYCYDVPRHPYARVAWALQQKSHQITRLKRQFKESELKKVEDRCQESIRYYSEENSRNYKELQELRKEQGLLNEAVAQIAELEGLLAATRHPVNR